MFVKQQWRIWPGPLGRSGKPLWALEPGTEALKVFTISNENKPAEEATHRKTTADSELILTQDGHLCQTHLMRPNDNIANGLPNSYRLFRHQDTFPKSTKIVDVCQFPQIHNHFIVVTDYGQAFLVNVVKEEVVQTISNFKVADPSDFPSLSVDFTSCASGQNHVVLVDKFGKAWSTGTGPQTGNIGENLRQSHHHQSGCATLDTKFSVTKIDFFQGSIIQ